MSNFNLTTSVLIRFSQVANAQTTPFISKALTTRTSRAQLFQEARNENGQARRGKFYDAVIMSGTHLQSYKTLRSAIPIKPNEDASIQAMTKLQDDKSNITPHEELIGKGQQRGEEQEFPLGSHLYTCLYSPLSSGKLTYPFYPI